MSATPTVSHISLTLSMTYCCFQCSIKPHPLAFSIISLNISKPNFVTHCSSIDCNNVMITLHFENSAGEQTTFQGQKDTQMPTSEFSEEIKEEIPPKRMRINDKVNGFTISSESDTIKGSIMELEELACKVKWLKMVLNHGSVMLNTLPSWKFKENLVTATTK